MELIANIGLGLSTAVTPANLLYCLIGVFLGTLIGVLPGLGPTATISMLLPITFALPPVSALIMLAGIYYGSQYGGSTTSILVNLPGEAASVVTTLDGYQMAKQGRAGVALATSAIGSFFAGTVATLLLALFAPPLAAIALKFGPADYFSLMVLGLVASVVLAQGSLLHAIAMVLLGLLLGLVGTDVNSGAQRYTFGIAELADGIGFVVVAMGMFGLAEIIRNLEREEAPRGDSEDHQPDADEGGLEADGGADPARYSYRLGCGHIAGERLDPGIFRRLLVRKEDLEKSRTIRQGRHRRRRRTGGGQQRRCADIVYSDADVGHSFESGDGTDGRRDDHSGNPARAFGHKGTAGAVLGHHRFHVDRQLFPDHPQLSAHRSLGADDHGALPFALSVHSGLLCHWRVQPEKQRVRYLSHGAVRRARVCFFQGGLRACADVARLHSRPLDGRIFAPRHAALPRQPLGICPAAH